MITIIKNENQINQEKIEKDIEKLCKRYSIDPEYLGTCLVNDKQFIYCLSESELKLRNAYKNYMYRHFGSRKYEYAYGKIVQSIN